MEKHGHSHVPNTRDPNHHDEVLGRWVETQRSFRKSGDLRQDREQRLEEMGFDWEPMESAWIEMLQHCRAFRASQGHLAIPVRSEEHPELSAWAADKRARYRDGTLAAGHVRALEKPGFCWDLQLRVWYANFDQYRRIWKRAGGQPTRRQMGAKLSDWLGWMSYNRDRLSAEQMELLESVNFAWDPYGDSRKPTGTRWFRPEVAPWVNGSRRSENFTERGV